MNVYDEAHRLANSIKGSEEFKNYSEKREKVYSDERTKQMVEDFRKKALKAQMEHLSGEEIEPEETEKLKKLEDVLMLSPTINDFFMAESRFTQLISDVYGIIEDAIKLNEE